jgi:hypothetical protein
MDAADSGHTDAGRQIEDRFGTTVNLFKKKTSLIDDR